jgi:CBS domain-containing protein
VLNFFFFLSFPHPDLSAINPYFAIREDEPLQTAMDIFLRGPHRIGITDSSNKLQKILTQSAVLRYFASHPSRLPSFKGDVTTSQFLKKRTVQTVSSMTLAIDAFAQMKANKVTSIAVVDHDVLVGVLSSSDLKVSFFFFFFFFFLFISLSLSLSLSLSYFFSLHCRV